VIRLPSISNFFRFRSARAEPSVRLRWLRPARRFRDRPDAVLIPGSTADTARPGSPQKPAPMAAELALPCWGCHRLFWNSAVGPADAGKGPGGSRGAEEAWRRCPAGVEALCGPPRLFLPLLTPLRRPQRPLRQCKAQALWPARLIWSWRVFRSCIPGPQPGPWSPRWRTAWSKAMAAGLLGQCADSGLVAAQRRRWVVPHLPAMGCF